MIDSRDKIEYVVEFGEPVFTWKDPCPTCGREHNTVEPGTVPTCQHCKSVLGDAIPARWWK